MKVFSHDATGGMFPSTEAAKSYNADDPDADLYSILDQIENYRRDGVFHIKLCYEELSSKYKFPCNEWTQSSNMAEESDITDYNPIRIAFGQSGTGSGSFGGLGISPKSPSTLIDDLPNHPNWHYAIGSTEHYQVGIPGPCPCVSVAKVELFLAKIEERLTTTTKTSLIENTQTENTMATSYTPTENGSMITMSEVYDNGSTNAMLTTESATESAITATTSETPAGNNSTITTAEVYDNGSTNSMLKSESETTESATTESARSQYAAKGSKVGLQTYL